MARRRHPAAARKRLEDQLRQTQKLEALGKLASGVAHDFNNLLTVIGGHAELLQLSLRENAAACAHAREVTTATARAARLTRQLLAYSRRQVLEPQVLDLGQAVDQLSGMLRRLIGENVELITQQAPDRLFVRVDRGQLEQVILNLAINARDAMPKGGTLILGTTPIEAREVVASGYAGADLPAGPLVCLSVKDTGVGMDATVMSQAFDPFFTTKEPGKGTGLGLSTVYGIVRQSDGVVWFESAPHAGTTAWVCLPRVAQPADQPAGGASPVATIPGSGTVLVVEDEPQVREFISRTLLVSGYAGAAPDPADPLGAEIAFLAKPFTPSTLSDRVRACIAVGHAEPSQADRPGACQEGTRPAGRIRPMRSGRGQLPPARSSGGRDTVRETASLTA